MTRWRPTSLTAACCATALWALALVAALGLLAGWIALRWITRPLRRLTGAVAAFDQHDAACAEQAERAIAAASVHGGNDVAALGQAFAQLARRTAEQWRELSQTDQQRRELFAHLSHDLRTPLTTMHGCLETLLVKSAALAEPQRRHYLEVALAESRKVGRLAQELFDLARLESGLVKPEKEASRSRTWCRTCSISWNLRPRRGSSSWSPKLPPRCRPCRPTSA